MRLGELGELPAPPVPGAESPGQAVAAVLAVHAPSASVRNTVVGPTLTRVLVDPGSTRAEMLRRLAPTWEARVGGAVSVVSPVPGAPGLIGVELPSVVRRVVRLADVPALAAGHPLTVLAGVDAVSGEPVSVCLAELPHLLVAGTTGAGKSTWLHSAVATLGRQSPSLAQLVLMDPSQSEFPRWARLRNLACPVVVDAWECVRRLEQLVQVMEERFAAFGRSGASCLDEHNEAVMDGRTQGRVFPFLVVIVDELAHVVSVAATRRERGKPNAAWVALEALAARGRRAGIHLVLGTQRPSVDVVNGVIKANVAARLVFQVASAVDARVVGVPGADRLLGAGDGLLVAGGRRVRVQAALPPKK